MLETGKETAALFALSRRSFTDVVMTFPLLKVIKEALKFCKDEKQIEVMGGDLVGEVSYRFSLTDVGRKRAREATDICGYVGPAPDSLARPRGRLSGR